MTPSLVFELELDKAKPPKIQAILREMISRSQHRFGYRLICSSKSRIVQVLVITITMREDKGEPLVFLQFLPFFPFFSSWSLR